MSLSFADDSYIGAISQWVDSHLWVGSGQQQSILVVQVDDTTQQYSVESGFNDLQVSANYTSGVDQLAGVTVSLDIPEFGLVTLVEESTYPLSTDPGQNLTISIAGGAIIGNVSFQYVGEGSDTEVFTDYYLEVPFSDNLEDSTSIFPVDFKRVKTIDSPQSVNQKRSEGSYHARLRTRDGDNPDEDQLLIDFLADFTRDGDKIVIDIYNPAPSGKFQASSKSGPSGEYQFSISFLGIFEMTGSIDSEQTCSAILYAKIPFLGRVALTRLNGNLGSGITSNIDLVLAKGTVTLTEDSSKNLNANIDVNVKSLKRISVQNLKLLTLPF